MQTILPAKKNKRGDRGSVEEETSTAKKTANMAADNGPRIEESIDKINEQEQLAKPPRNQAVIGGYSDPNSGGTHRKSKT